MILYASYNGENIPAVFRWKIGTEFFYEPITPTGYINWICENLGLLDKIKERPDNWKQLGIY